TEPKGDPLKEWLNSCESIRARLPDTVLVLPGHLAPFLGLHVRLTQIIESHERALVTLFDALAEPRRAVDCARVMFRRELTNEILVMATGETLAHLNCLVGRRMVRRERDADGVDWYTQKPDTVDFTM
ncbi:MAG TPA: MBL fold metallo-hydrolase, partial [Pseudomonadales bacterium]|nr:MBL fold metallo-hydrolase [Pseudomonadales bacterium]